MKVRLSLHKDGRVAPGADILPTFSNLQADYERGLALVDVPNGVLPPWFQAYEHPKDAPIDEGEIKHLTSSEREQLKRWMNEAYPDRPEWEQIDLG